MADFFLSLTGLGLLALALLVGGFFFASYVRRTGLDVKVNADIEKAQGVVNDIKSALTK